MQYYFKLKEKDHWHDRVLILLVTRSRIEIELSRPLKIRNELCSYTLQYTDLSKYWPSTWAAFSNRLEEKEKVVKTTGLRLLSMLLTNDKWNELIDKSKFSIDIFTCAAQQKSHLLWINSCLFIILLYFFVFCLF